MLLLEYWNPSPFETQGSKFLEWIHNQKFEVSIHIWLKIIGITIIFQGEIYHFNQATKEMRTMLDYSGHQGPLEKWKRKQGIGFISQRRISYNYWKLTRCQSPEMPNTPCHFFQQFCQCQTNLTNENVFGEWIEGCHKPMGLWVCENHS